MTHTKPKKLETTKISNQNKTKVLEKTKPQVKKVKEKIEHDSKKNIQKSNNIETSVDKNEELVNIEYNTTNISSVESAIKPINEETKNITDISLNTK